VSLEYPDSIQTLFDQALAAEHQGDWRAAVRLYEHAETLAPREHRLPANRGNALWLADAPWDALRAQQRAVTLAPGEALPLRGLGNALRDLNRYEAAEAAYARASRIQDDSFTAWNRSQNLMGLERYAQAFRLAEERWQLPQATPYRQGPFWQDWPLSSRLTIWSEQGFGDTFQFLRWVVPLARWGVALNLEVEPQLVQLLRQSLAWLPKPPQVQAKQDPPTPLQGAHGSLLSLPHLLGGGTLAGTITPAEGYLRAPHWHHRSPRSEPRVGLVWAAGRKLDQAYTAREYWKRSLPTAALEALLSGLRRQGAWLCNLQFGPDRNQAQGWGDHFDHTLAADADFATAATLISDLDLVISVDTATAHLVGAMGKQGWILLPWSADPRWLRDRADTPWYPSLTLLRQPAHGDWSSLVHAVLKRFSSWRQQWNPPLPAAADPSAPPAG
jgi:tetratricopeptide (TPR) repeat protein